MNPCHRCELTMQKTTNFHIVLLMFSQLRAVEIFFKDLAEKALVHLKLPLALLFLKQSSVDLDLKLVAQDQISHLLTQRNVLHSKPNRETWGTSVNWLRDGKSSH